MIMVRLICLKLLVAVVFQAKHSNGQYGSYDDGVEDDADHENGRCLTTAECREMYAQVDPVFVKCISGTCEFCSKADNAVQFCPSGEQCMVIGSGLTKEVRCQKIDVDPGNDVCRNDDECDDNEECGRNGRCLQTGCRTDEHCRDRFNCKLIKKIWKCVDPCKQGSFKNCKTCVKSKFGSARCGDAAKSRVTDKVLHKGDRRCTSDEDCNAFYAKEYPNSTIKCGKKGKCYLEGCKNDLPCRRKSRMGGCVKKNANKSVCNPCKYYKKHCGKNSKCKIVNGVGMCYDPTNPLEPPINPTCNCPSASSCVLRKNRRPECVCDNPADTFPTCKFPPLSPCHHTTCPSPFYNCRAVNDNGKYVGKCYCRSGKNSDGSCRRPPTVPPTRPIEPPCRHSGNSHCKVLGCQNTLECVDAYPELAANSKFECRKGVCLVFDCLYDRHCPGYGQGGGCSEGKCDPCKFPDTACDRGSKCMSDAQGEKMCKPEMCSENCQTRGGYCDVTEHKCKCDSGVYPNCDAVECPQGLQNCDILICRKIDSKTIFCKCRYGYDPRTRQCNNSPLSVCKRWSCFQYQICKEVSSVDLTCECEFGGVYPNCKIINPEPPINIECEIGRNCNEGCVNSIECQIYHKDPRLVCYNGLCIIPGCQHDDNCNKGSKCENKYCDPCGYKNCRKNEVCVIRGQSGTCIEKTCDDLECYGSSHCIIANRGPACVCNIRSLSYPMCEEDAECSNEENICGTFSTCKKVSYNKIHCECKHGGQHPHCKMNPITDCKNSNECTENPCSHSFCDNLLQRCVIDYNSRPLCQCRLRGLLGDCKYVGIVPNQGSQKCENDIECQETYNVDHFCYKGKCILQGCRTDVDCPKSGCSYNGYCDTCKPGAVGELTCRFENKNCKLQDESFICVGKCPTECPPNKTCKMNRKGKYECQCRNGLDTDDCRERSCDCDESSLSVCNFNSAGESKCKCRMFQDTYPDCKCRTYCGSDETAHCNNDPHQGYCSCNEGYIGTPPNCMENKPKCNKECEPGQMCEIEFGQQICKCINDDCSPLCDSLFCGYGKCILTKYGNPVCYCENGLSPPSCSNAPEPQCEEDCGFGKCIITENNLVKCACEDSRFSPPSCGKPCEKDCEKNHHCIHSKGREECVCDYEGEPPNCKTDPCDNIFCDKEVSRCIVFDGIPKCQCLNDGSFSQRCSRPPLCSIETCNEFSSCSVIDSKPQCICLNGGKYPQCKYACDKNCGDLGVCIFDPAKRKKDCICKQGFGKYPDCKEDPCTDFECPPTSECVFNGQETRCACTNGYAGVDPFCFPSCNSKICSKDQKCVIINRKAECICSQAGVTMPACKPDPCQHIDCGKDSECTVSEFGRGVCICKDSGLVYPCCDEQKPDCNPCDSHFCEKSAKCVVDANGRAKCLCKGKGFYPNCKPEPTCDTQCNEEGKYFINSAGACICLCKDKIAEYPECRKPCMGDCEGGICNNGVCECINPERDFPRCNENCNEIDCKSGKCHIIDGLPACLCPDGNEPPCLNCKERCKETEECVKGRCIKACQCNENSQCIRDPSSMEPSCICNNGGIYPTCNECGCAQDQICVHTSETKTECVCKVGFSKKCTSCDPSLCRFGRCSENENGLSQCSCNNPSFKYPDCEMICPTGMQAVKRSTGDTICLCPDFSYPGSDDCSSCKTNDDCGKKAKCVYNEESEMYSCKCENSFLLYPNCNQDCDNPYCPCNDFGCPRDKKCVVLRGNPICICKNGQSGGDCNGSCSKEISRKCQNVGGSCEIINGQEVCNCGRYSFDTCVPKCNPPCRGQLQCISPYGGVPECRCLTGDCDEVPPVVKLYCELCEGTCITNEDLTQVCICTNGGVPPYCKRIPTICDIDCGAGYCEINSQGIPECICIPSRKKCNEGSYCTTNGECKCNFSSNRDGSCKPFCSLSCNPGSTCKKELFTNKETCVCIYGGKYPNCESCDLNCKGYEVCALVEGRPTCVCRYTLADKCDIICDTKCDQGKCVYNPTTDKQLCVCLSNSRNYAKCDDPCSKIVCKENEKCIVLDNGTAKCDCKNQSKRYPNCSPSCEELNCEKNKGRCVRTQNGDIECVCSNGYSNFPNCKEIECDCPDKSKCVIIGGHPKCRCLNGVGIYPHCELCGPVITKFCNDRNGICAIDNNEEKCICSKEGSTGIFPNCEDNPIGICGPAKKKECEEENGICVIDNNEEICICSKEYSTGIFPNCDDDWVDPMCSPAKKKECEEENGICVIENNEEKCEVDCEKTCRGTCVEDENGKMHCICLNGGIPNMCEEPQPLCNDLLCENGNCIVENGKAKCECDDENLEPSTCTKCSKKCKDHETCDRNGKCVCSNGGQKPCKSFCRKRCSRGYKMIDRMGNCLCNCLYGGLSRNRCIQPVCTLKCKKNEICIIDGDGEEKCICSNLKESCIGCNKDCLGGKCGILDGEETCLCPDGSKDYPQCTRVPKKSCPGGKSIFDNDGNEVCVCIYESTKSSIYPDCKKFPRDCNGIKCGQKGKCVLLGSGRLTCACKNGYHNFPKCTDDSTICSKECTSKQKCVLAGGREFCVCKDGQYSLPLCDETAICTKLHIKVCAEQSSFCAVIDDSPWCICESGVGSPPNCNLNPTTTPTTVVVKPREQPCICINGECIEDAWGNEFCVCKNGGIPPNCLFSPPCEGINCGNGHCITLPGVPKYNSVCECANGLLTAEITDIQSCIPECDCGEHEFCKVDKCVCKYGKPRNGKCEPICKKDCGRARTCVYDPIENTEQCICNHYSLETGECQLISECDYCGKNEICVEDNGEHRCICANLEENCPIPTCPLKCNNQSYCVLIHGVPTCICKDGRGKFPDCKGPCYKKDCNGYGRCIEKNKRAYCICSYEASESGSNYPNCNNPCDKIDCGNNGICVQFPNGLPGCICENQEYNNYPLCDSSPPCPPNWCGHLEKCVVLKNGPLCVCKNGKGQPPFCDDGKICGPQQQEVCGSNAICVVDHIHPKCVCKSGHSTFPNCEYPSCTTESDCENDQQCQGRRCKCKVDEEFKECEAECDLCNCRPCPEGESCRVQVDRGTGKLKRICEQKPGCSRDSDCVDDSKCLDRTCKCPVPNGKLLGLNVYDSCSDTRCDICRCANKCPKRASCNAVYKNNILVRECETKCSRRSDCKGDQQLVLCPRGECTCNLQYPDDDGYEACIYPVCNPCECNSCPGDQRCQIRHHFGPVSRYCGPHTLCKTTFDCEGEAFCEKEEEEEQGFCRCKKSPGSLEENCQYPNCKDCFAICDLSYEDSCGICTSDEDCAPEKECSSDGSCECRCRTDPATGECEKPCNICTSPRLFKENCGDVLKHAGCYPPSKFNPEAQCACHFNEMTKPPETKECMEYCGAKRCHNYNGEFTSRRREKYDKTVQLDNQDYIAAHDLYFGDVLEINCPYGCIEMVKAMYYCNMHRGMDLKLHEKHLKVAQDICDGHERCVLQAVGGIFDVGDDGWKECQDSQQTYVLWVEYKCNYPSEAMLGRWTVKDIEYYGTKDDISERFCCEEIKDDPEARIWNQCYGSCHHLDVKYGYSAKTYPKYRFYIGEEIPMYCGYDLGRPCKCNGGGGYGYYGGDDGYYYEGGYGDDDAYYDNIPYEDNANANTGDDDSYYDNIGYEDTGYEEYPEDNASVKADIVITSDDDDGGYGDGYSYDDGTTNDVYSYDEGTTYDDSYYEGTTYDDSYYE